MKKIVSHTGERHLDDWLAIALLKWMYPQAKVEYVSPQGVPASYLKDKDICLVDVGGSYAPLLNNYDHHHDKDLPCSLVLVVRNFFNNLYPSKVIDTIDIIDRFGFNEALNRRLIKHDREIDRLRKIILLTDPNNPHIGYSTNYLLGYARESQIDLSGFITMLYNSLKVQGLTHKAERYKGI